MEPQKNVDISERLKALEEGVKNTKKLSVFSTVCAIILGSSGIFGLVQWLYTGPKMTKEINNLQVKFREVNDRLKNTQDSINIVKSKLATRKEFREEEIKSLENEIRNLKNLPGNEKKVRHLITKLIEREQAYRNVMSDLESVNNSMLQSNSLTVNPLVVGSVLSLQINKEYKKYRIVMLSL